MSWGHGSEGWAWYRSESLRGPEGWRAPANQGGTQCSRSQGRRHGPEQVARVTRTLRRTILQGWPWCHPSPTILLGSPAPSRVVSPAHLPS